MFSGIFCQCVRAGGSPAASARKPRLAECVYRGRADNRVPVTRRVWNTAAVADYLKLNRANWDDRVPAHVASAD